MLKRFLKGLVGTANDVLEEAADKNIIPEHRQNIREAEGEIKKLDVNISSVIGQRKQADKKVSDLESKIANYESEAVGFAQQQNNEMALKIAQEVSNLRPQLETAKQHRDVLANNEQKLKQQVTSLKDSIVKMKEELSSLESTEMLLKAQEATLNVTTGMDSKCKTALESVERVKARQAKRAAQIEGAQEWAAEQAAPQGLDAEIAAAKAGSVDSSAEAELQRMLEAANKK